MPKLTPKTLGLVEKTDRGFEIVRFKDRYGEECSLQQSSLADYMTPGMSAVWLGCNKASNHSVTGEALQPRMHLDRKQVQSLVKHLQNWLNKNKF